MLIEKDNPFLLMGYQGKQLFCDRENELERLISNAKNGVNTTMISIRRMGKSGILWRLKEEMLLYSNAICIYVDLYDTHSLNNFNDSLAAAIYKSVPKKSRFWNQIAGFIRQLRPIISYDELTGNPSISISYAHEHQREHTLQGMLSFLDGLGVLVLVAFDEFQQIGNYSNDKHMEAMLRSKIQSLKNVQFIFSGSSTHMLTQMFYQPNRPFYSSASALTVREIDEQRYHDFIKNHFNARKKTISDEAVNWILSFSRRHTYYTQSVCNRVYSSGKRKIGLDDVIQIAYYMLREQEAVYYQYRKILSDNQWNLLVATGKEQEVKHPTAKDFIQKHSLGAISSIKRSMESLIDKEMLYFYEKEDGDYLRITDVFLSRWIEYR